ncbi:uncharacterized protein [Rutidosis leptorrhynchoides]|uniref:uncharacterized protein n=1 Tax=Rutidosis leptorrhynchoides TaxID=125765 RepID=UPI003A98D1E8
MRLPVRVELDKCGIDLDSIRCPICDNDAESVEHMILSCPKVMDVWVRIFRWYNLGNVNTLYSGLNDMFKGKVVPSDPNSPSKIWQAIEWVTGYLIWRYRNLKVFENKDWNAPTMVIEIQAKSFLWISSRTKKVKIEWNQWLLNPSVFDGHG